MRTVLLYLASQPLSFLSGGSNPEIVGRSEIKGRQSVVRTPSISKSPDMILSVSQEN